MVQSPLVSARTVMRHEWLQIRRRRQAAGYEGDEAAHGHQAPEALTGLALSGGGIRSATFCLGVLQQLHASGLLRAVDYLSTVSGGGFIGGWWTAWLTRAETIGLFPPPERIEPARTPPPESRRLEFAAELTSAGVDPIHHLRLFANYLTPRKGVLSADTWRAVTVVSRNILVTWAALLPLLLGTIVVLDVYFVAFDPSWLQPYIPDAPRDWTRRVTLVAGPVAALLGWIVVMIATWVRYTRDSRFFTIAASTTAVTIVALLLRSLFPAPAAPLASPSGSGLIRGGWVLWAWVKWMMTDPRGLAALAWTAVAVGLVVYATRESGDGARAADWREVKRNQIVRVHSALLVTLVLTSAAALLGAFGHELVNYLLFGSAPRNAVLAYVKQSGGWIAVIVSAAGAIFTAWRAAPAAAADRQAAERPGRVASLVFKLTPPLVLVLLALVLAWAAQWTLARLAANLHQGALRPLAFCAGICLVLCASFAWDEARRLPTVWPRGGRSGASVRIGAFVLMLGVVAYAAAGLRWSARMETVLLAAAVVFAIGLVAWVGALLRLQRSVRATNTRPLWLLAFGYLGGAALLAATVYAAQPVQLAVVVVLTVSAWILAIGWTADPNLVSLHTFYKARLTRAYLGASNRQRAQDQRHITEAARGDDVNLTEVLRAVERGGPYHLINTTLNLVGGRDLATAQRSSDRFILSPLYCGSSRTRYRRTVGYMSGRLRLGTAMAVSGAAVSPTMGAVSPTAALAMLLALLNVRLGYWAPSPNKVRWAATSATLWPFYQLFELLSQTNELSSYCYLTDGGHFDNTGLYSLFERGCQNILLADCGADPRPGFEDLGTAIRRARIDFGTDVSIRLDPLLAADGRPPRSHFIVGTIKYSAEHAQALGRPAAGFDGILVVIKPSLVGDEVADVRQYGFQNEAFPQQTTADQWFGEAQFESYRRLGQLSAGRLTDLAATELQPLATGAGVRPATVTDVFRAFERNRW